MKNLRTQVIDFFTKPRSLLAKQGRKKQREEGRKEEEGGEERREEVWLKGIASWILAFGQTSRMLFQIVWRPLRLDPWRSGPAVGLKSQRPRCRQHAPYSSRSRRLLLPSQTMWEVKCRTEQDQYEVSRGVRLASCASWPSSRRNPTGVDNLRPPTPHPSSQRQRRCHLGSPDSVGSTASEACKAASRAWLWDGQSRNEGLATPCPDPAEKEMERWMSHLRR